jgi:parallel beta-helix repeat protein
MERRDFLLGFSATGAVASTQVAAAADADALAARGVKIAPTMADLRALKPTLGSSDQVRGDPRAGALAWLRGHRRPNDGGEGFFHWDAESKDTDNGGTIIAAIDIESGRWLRAAQGGPISVKWFGAKGDGSAAAKEIQDALSAGSEIFVPAGTYLIDSSITVLEGKHLFGPGKLVGIKDVVMLRVRSGCFIDGLHFSGDTAFNKVCVSVYPAEQQDVTVTRCRFDLQYRWAYGITSSENCARLTITENVFSGPQQAMTLTRPNKCVVANNKIDGADQSIKFESGRENIVTNNTVSGCRVGILFLNKRWEKIETSRLFGNIVTSNIVEDIDEEGISFDASNSNKGWPEHPNFPIVSYVASQESGIATRISILQDGQPPGWADGYYALVISGQLRGNFFKISSSGNRYFDLEESSEGLWRNAAPGDKAIITTGIFRNIVSHNSVRNCGTACITFWGSSWFNVIKDNSVARDSGSPRKGSGIQISSVVHPLGPGPGSGMRAYSGYNLVEGNSISVAGEMAGSKKSISPILIETRAYSQPDIGDEYLTPRNIIRNNILSGIAAIQCDRASDIVIEGNQFSGSRARILLSKCHNPVVTNNYGNSGLMKPETKI